MADTPLLTVRNLQVSYDGIEAVRDISFTVNQGEIVTLIGGNGAGKSTILRSISGMVSYTGSINYKGEELRQIRADLIVKRGITHVPEGRGIFGNLTVLENLRLAAWHRKDKHGIKEDLERIFLLFPRLKERSKQLSITLSGGEQQMLAVSRALMNRGEILLLDEPSMGLAPVLVREIFKVLTDINRSGVTILLVEQNAHQALQISNQAYVLETGRIILSGTGQELMLDPRVKAAYLGG